MDSRSTDKELNAGPAIHGTPEVTLEQIRPDINEPWRVEAAQNGNRPVCPLCGARHGLDNGKPWNHDRNLNSCEVFLRHYGNNGHVSSRHFNPACRICQLEKIDAERWAQRQANRDREEKNREA